MGLVERKFFQLLFMSRMNLQSTVIEFVNVTKRSLLQWLMGLNRHIMTQLSYNNTSATIYSTCTTFILDRRFFFSHGKNLCYGMQHPLTRPTRQGNTERSVLLFFSCVEAM